MLWSFEIFLQSSWLSSVKSMRLICSKIATWSTSSYRFGPTLCVRGMLIYFTKIFWKSLFALKLFARQTVSSPPSGCAWSTFYNIAAFCVAHVKVILGGGWWVYIFCLPKSALQSRQYRVYVLDSPIHKGFMADSRYQITVCLLSTVCRQSLQYDDIPFTTLVRH